MAMFNNLVGPVITSYIAYAFFQRANLLRRMHDSILGKANRINASYTSFNDTFKAISAILVSKNVVINKKRLLTSTQKNCISGEIMDLASVLENRILSLLENKYLSDHRDIISKSTDEMLNIASVKQKIFILKTAGEPKFLDFLILILMFTSGIMADVDIFPIYGVEVGLRIMPFCLLIAGFVYTYFFGYGYFQYKGMIESLDKMEAIMMEGEESLRLISSEVNEGMRDKSFISLVDLKKCIGFSELSPEFQTLAESSVASSSSGSIEGVSRIRKKISKKAKSVSKKAT